MGTLENTIDFKNGSDHVCNWCMTTIPEEDSLWVVDDGLLCCESCYVTLDNETN